MWCHQSNLFLSDLHPNSPACHGVPWREDAPGHCPLLPGELSAAGSTLPAPGVGCCTGALPGGQRGKGEQGEHFPSAPPWDALGQQPAQVQGLGLNLPDGSSSLVQTPGLWLDPTSSPSLLLLSPKSPFHFRFTLGLPPLCL